MTENTYEMIMNISACMRTIVLTFCFVGLWRCLVESKFQQRNIILYTCVTIYLVLSDIIGLSASMRYIPVLFACVIYGYCFKICKWQIPTFLLLFLYNLHSMSFLISNSIFQLVADYANERLDMDSPDMMGQVYFQACILSVVMILLYAVLLTLLCGMFSRMHIEISDISSTEFIFLSVLNMAGIILARMVAKLLVVPLENGVFVLYDEISGFLWVIPIISILLLIGEYSSIFIFYRYKKYLGEREVVIARELALKQLQSRFQEAQMLYGDLRSLRHDMKNHMQIIKGLSSLGGTEEADAYVEKLNEAIEELDGKYSTGNTLCDVILNDKYRIAKKNKIDFHVDFRYESGISDFDLGIILSNLCDNAIEACQKVEEEKRRIYISYTGAGPCMLLSVKNSYDGKRILWAENGLPLSTKVSGNSHGIGLKNVSVITESYLGNLQIETSGEEFCATVMLQKKQNENPITT